MGLADQLRRLDERVLPAHGGRGRGRWKAAAGVLGAVAVAVAIVVPRLDEPTPPLGFDCTAPAQPIVEDVLDVDVDASGGVGGSQAQQTTSYWASGGRRVVSVTCTSASASDLAEAAPRDDDPGYVAGSPPFTLAESAGQEYASEVRFVHQQALVVMRTATAVDESGARELVTSWLRQVELFAG